MRYRLGMLLICCLAGCAGIEQVPRDGAIRDDAYYVAFSVKTRHVEIGESNWWPGAVSIGAGRASGDFIPVVGYPEGAVFLYEVPDADFAFRNIAVYETRDPDAVPTRYRTYHDGHRVELPQGAITYLGRVEIADIAYGRAREPSAVTVNFSDRSEPDLAAIVESYPAIAASDFRVDVHADWSGSANLRRMGKRRYVTPRPNDIMPKELGPRSAPSPPPPRSPPKP